MRKIVLKYEGNCRRCDELLEVGQEAMYEKSQGIFCLGHEPKDSEEIRHFRQLKADRKAERLESKACRLENVANEKMSAFNSFRGDIAFMTQPGRIPFRDKITKRYDKGCELMSEAQEAKEKAERLRSGVRVKGDAAKRDQAYREEITKRVKVGDKIESCFFGVGVIEKIFKKSLRVKWDRGFTNTTDKLFCKPFKVEG